MACIRKRRGKYVVDYRDGAGIRRWVTCATRRQAEDVLAERGREARQQTRPVVDSNITLSATAGPNESAIGFPLSFAWTGVTSSDKAGNATFLCPAAGLFPVSVAVSNGDPACTPGPGTSIQITLECDALSATSDAGADADAAAAACLSLGVPCAQAGDTYLGCNRSVRHSSETPRHRHRGCETTCQGGARGQYVPLRPCRDERKRPDSDCRAPAGGNLAAP